MSEFHTETGTIYYQVSGPEDAPPLALLHNFMSDGRSAWGSLVPRLAEQWRVIVPDLPGHGRSLGYPQAYDHTEIARQVADLLIAERAEQSHLAGCSSGGMIAQLLVQHSMINARTLTLVSTTYSVNPATTNNHAVITPENFKAGRGWMEATARLHDPYQGEGYYFGTLLPGFRALTPATAIDLTLADLQQWPLPVCIIQGADDEFFPSFVVEAMAEALPNAELHLIPDQTHALLFRQPWQVRDRMLDFLQRHDSTKGES